MKRAKARFEIRSTRKRFSETRYDCISSGTHRAWFRLHHVGELAKSRFLLAIIKYADMAELADAHGSGDTTSVNLQNHVFYLQKIKYADMAELADAHGSGHTTSVNLQIRLYILQNSQQFHKCGYGGIGRRAWFR